MKRAPKRSNPFLRFIGRRVKRRQPLYILAALLIAFAVLVTGVDAQKSSDAPDRDQERGRTNTSRIRIPLPADGDTGKKNPQIFRQYTIAVAADCSLKPLHATLQELLSAGALKQAPLQMGNQLRLIVEQEQVNYLSVVQCVQEITPGWHPNPPLPQQRAGLDGTKTSPPAESEIPFGQSAVAVETGIISGTVTADSGGDPLAGIKVCAYSQNDDDWQTIVCTYTDPVGEYQIDLLAAGDYRVGFSDDQGDYVPQYYDDAPDIYSGIDVVVTVDSTTSGIDAALSGAGFIAGTVTAELSGSPIPGINVCTEFDNGAYWANVGCVFTDANGDYEIRGLPAGSHRVWFSDGNGDYAWEYYDDVPDEDSAATISVSTGNTTSGINAALAERGHITGTVTADLSGAFLFDIYVCAYYDNYGWQTLANCDYTDAQGAYDIGTLPGGVYRVKFYDSSGSYLGEYYSDAADFDSAIDIVVTAGSTISGIDAALAEAGHITGTVTADLGGAPLENIDVCAYSYAGSFWQNDGCGSTDANGYYDINGLSTGAYRVEFYDLLGDYYLSEYYDDAPNIDSAIDVFVTAGSATSAINAALSEPGHISGTVTAAVDGALLEAIEACAYFYDGADWQEGGCDYTDVNGTYDIASLPPGVYRVGFNDSFDLYAWEYYDDALDIDSASDISVNAGSTVSGINAALVEGGHITGAVTAEVGGAALKDIAACAYIDIGSGWRWVGCGYSDANGAYDISGLAAGIYRVEFYDWLDGIYLGEYYDDAPDIGSASNIAVTAGDTAAGIDAALTEYGHISGTVTAEFGGEPLFDIEVCAYFDNGSDWQWLGCVYSDANGDYDMGGLQSRSYRLEFTDYSGKYRSEYYDNAPDLESATDIPATAGSTISGIDAALRDYGHITGRVTAEANGAPLAGIRVCSYRDEGSYWYVSFCDDTAANGDYDIGGLTTGVYRVGFFDNSGSYQIEYYDDGANIYGAIDVYVTDDSTTIGIDAALSISAPSPPDNDDFAAARAVQPVPYQDILDVRVATNAADDPVLPCGPDNTGNGSVWYAITPAQASLLEADTFGSNYDTVLTVWEGVQGSLVAVACNDDTFGSQSKLTHVGLVGGKTYLIEIAAYSSDLGELVLNIDLVPKTPFADCSSDTGSRASIVIPTDVTINGDMTLESGDEFALFRPDGGVCAGHGVWTGSELDLSAWGDDIGTAEIEGFIEGDEIVFQVWDPVEDRFYVITNVTYSYTSHGADTYKSDEDYFVSALDVASSLIQAIPLSAGWNMISSYVEPDDPALETLLAGIESKMVVMENGDGEIYWPDEAQNDIGDWDVRDGYKLYMDKAATLNIAGLLIDPAQTPIDLLAGWSMIAYLRDAPLPVDQALNSINSQLFTAKNGAGEVYWPVLGVNQIGDMQPGEGYQVYLDSAATLIYPSSQGAVSQPAAGISPAAPSLPEAKPAREFVPADRTEKLASETMDISAATQATHFTNCEHNTGNNATVGIATDVTVSDMTLEAGDEIAIFTPDWNICAGVQVWDGQNTAAAAWGNNDQTSGLEGLQTGQEMKYRIWDSSTQTEHLYCQASYTAGADLGEGFYAVDSFHILASLTPCSDTETVNFDAAADSHVRSSYPDNNFGSTVDLRVKHTSTIDFYTFLKFDVQGVTGAVRKATLRLYVDSESVSGGTAYVVNDSSWSESGITWNNAPAMAQALGSVGQANVGKWVEFDVTTAVTGDGLMSIGIASSSSDLVKYSSKEGSNAPQLVVEYESGASLPGVCTYAIDDAYVHSDRVDDNFGSSSTIRIKDAAADFNGYLKFNVQGVSGVVQRAILKLNVVDASSDGGTVYEVIDNGWIESAITWNNAPAMGQVLDSVGQVNVWQWVEFDVTPAVTDSGLVSLGMKSSSNDLVTYSSKDGTTTPQLCVEFEEGTPPPVADFEADPVIGQPPLAVQFIDLSTESPTSWQWDFGDGGSASEQNPNHTYETPGTYTVSLTVSNSAGTDMKTRVDLITVEAPPAITCSEPTADAYVRSNYPKNNYGSTSDIRIKDAAADFYGYLKFNVQGVTGPVQKATLKLYGLDSSDDGGTAYEVSDTSWSEDGITWNNAPPMGPALTSSGQVSVGEWVEFDVTAAVTGDDPLSFGLRSGSSDLVKYSSREGTDAPQLCVEYESGPLPPPVAEFTAVPITGTVPLAVQFTDLSTGLPASWAWDFGDGGGSLEQHPNHTYDTPGIYTVTLTVSNSTASDTETKTDYITVEEPPQIACSVAVADTHVRSSYPTTNYGSTVDLRVKDASAVFYSYLKFNIEGVAGPVQNATLKLYVISASVEGGTAYEVADKSWGEGDITWNDAPAMGAALGSVGQATVGEWVEFDVSSAVLGNGLISLGIKSSSSDLVKYSSREGSDAPQLCVEYESGPLPPPVAEFVADNLNVLTGQTVQFFDQSTGSPFSSWAWDFGDGSGSTEQNPGHTYDTPGAYTVSLTVTNSTASDTETKTDYITVTEPPQVTIFDATADTHVRSNYPDNNYGSDNELRVKNASADFHSYLKFDVQGVTGAVQQATLRLYVTSASAEGGQVYKVVDTSWSESGMTWNNAPGISGDVLDSVGQARVGEWVEFDVTSAVTGDGLLSLGIKTGSSDLVKYSSKEGSDPPQLVVEYEGGPLPPPVSEFTSDKDNGPAPLTVQFTDTSTGSPSSWAWDFGDGSGSVEQHPSYTYDTPGTYTVSLTVTNSTASDTETKTDYIIVSGVPQEVVFDAAADTHVRSSYPDNNYGSDIDIRVKNASVDFHSYLKFDVQGVTGAVQQATLRLYVTSESVEGGQAYAVSDTSWSESGMTWNNAPGTSGDVLDSVGRARVGKWVEFDVTSAVTGDGLLSFGIKTGSSDLVKYSSREGSDSPQLVVVYQ